MSSISFQFSAGVKRKEPGLAAETRLLALYACIYLT